MGKRHAPQNRCQGPTKKSITKKAQIDKLIQENESKPSSKATSSTRNSKKSRPPRQQKPPSGTPQRYHETASNRRVIPTEPKPIIPGLPEPHQQDLICDRRSLEGPVRALVRLPCEPTTSRALRYIPEGQFPFLQLPGELRNKVYNYVISEANQAIEWTHYNQQNKTLTHKTLRDIRWRGPKVPPGGPKHRRSLDARPRPDRTDHSSVEERHSGPTVLLFVCKQMSEEAASVLYSKSMFCFHGLRSLRHFLDNLRPMTMKSIRRMSLQYRAYGNPAKTEHQRWKEKHDRLWEDLCWRIADDCSLTQLRLELTLNKSPISFPSFDQVETADLGAHWIKPLWAFQDVGIQKCSARINCLSQRSTVLEVESWKLRKEILGELWNEDAEGELDAYGDGKEIPNQDGQKPLTMRLGFDGTVEAA